jgi:hypothetical protein
MDKSMPMAYHVRRAEFDEILLRNASRKNARVVESCQVREIDSLSIQTMKNPPPRPACP